MSDLASTEAISALTEAIRDLTVALNPPAADSDTVSIGDWELLGEESEDFRVKLDTTCLEVKYRTIEEGPGPTPAYCEDLALRCLTGKPPGPSQSFRCWIFCSESGGLPSPIYTSGSSSRIQDCSLGGSQVPCF